jgi:UDP-N-acetylglucosamine--N-acetylmuramyl-(pentapeptide) pyrophosphoryl-undecaprenol N-acetylglucosamine transferase
MLLAGGGTGGHLFPAVAIAEQLLAEDDSAVVQFVGTVRGLEARQLPRLGFALELIDISGVVGRGFFGLLQALPKLARSLGQSWRILSKFAPDVVVGVGGYASFPVLLAAGCRGIPCVIHEQNAQPGLSNRLLARLAQRVCLSIPGSGARLPQRKLVMTGNPLRRGLNQVSPVLPAAGSLLVFGGSRGARALNRLLVETLPLLRQAGMTAQLVHQTGSEDFAQVRRAYEEQQATLVTVVPFIDDMSAAYNQSRLVICRAGATTLAELCLCGRPALLVPYPHAAADHQSANARALERQQAAQVLPEAELTPARLAQAILELWHNPAQLEQMAAAARHLGQPDAARRVVEVCRQLAKGH